MFVSNSDNLGATMDLKLLTWFAQSGKPFAMECATRTEADKKGGHLAQSAKGLLLRESAQCPEADEKEFQNVAKHKARACFYRRVINCSASSHHQLCHSFG